MLAPNALVTLAELNIYVPTDSLVPDDVRIQREAAINRASALIEGFCDRRLVYRAPPEVEGSQNIVAEVALGNGPLTVAAHPAAPGRTIILTKVDADGSVKKGTVTVTGTVAGVVGVTEVFDLSLGPVLHGTKFFTFISGIEVAGVAGSDSADKVRVGTSQGYIEFHSPTRARTELWTLERPVRQLLQVHEDIYRAYGADTLLTVDEDYLVSAPLGHLSRLFVGSPFPSCWAIGFRTVRTILSAGYFTSANVPAAIKEVCLKLAAMMVREQIAKSQGLSTQGDAIGNWQRFEPVALTESMQQDLGPHTRARINLTGERDFDLEAA